MTAFGFETTVDEVLEGQDLEGKIAIVSGGTSGIDEEAAVPVGAFAVRRTGTDATDAVDVELAEEAAGRRGAPDVALGVVEAPVGQRDRAGEDRGFAGRGPVDYPEPVPAGILGAELDCLRDRVLAAV